MDIKTLKSRFILKEVRQREIAKELGVSRQLVNLVVLGKTKSYRTRKYIAKRLGFPEYEWEIFDKILENQ